MKKSRKKNIHPGGLADGCSVACDYRATRAAADALPTFCKGGFFRDFQAISAIPARRSPAEHGLLREIARIRLAHNKILHRSIAPSLRPYHAFVAAKTLPRFRSDRRGGFGVDVLKMHGGVPVAGLAAYPVHVGGAVLFVGARGGAVSGQLVGQVDGLDALGG